MSDSSTKPSLPEKPKNNRTGLFAGIAVVVVALIVGAVLLVPGWLGGGSSENADAASGNAVEPVSVRLGVADAGKSFWNILVEEAEAEGIDLEIVSFTDYNTPNPALASGDIDINKFQHVRYLAQYNASQSEGDALVAIGASEIYPIGFYSKKWESVEDVPQGAEVTLSNNPSNQVRPLLALEAAGLIEFFGNPGWSATLDDVDYANSTIGKITPIDPSLTAASLDSVDIAFVDPAFAVAAGVTEDLQIYVEDADRDDLRQYVNIFAVRADDADNEAYKTIVKLYHSAAVRDAIQAEDGFDGIFKEDVTPEQLADELEKQTALFR